MKPCFRFLSAIALVAFLQGCGGGEDSAESVLPTPPNSSPPTSSPATPTPSPIPPAPTTPQGNRAPELAQPIELEILAQFHPFSIDVTHGGASFRDPDGDQMQIEVVSNVQQAATLAFDGTHLSGTFLLTGDYQVTIVVRDGHGGELRISQPIAVYPNQRPTLNQPNAVHVVAVGSSFDYDTTQNGQVFRDPEGDAISYNTTILSQPLGLTLHGNRLSGQFSSHGAVRYLITATDSLGASESSEFLIVAPSPAPGRPQLPVTTYVYDDFRLDLPEIYLRSRVGTLPLMDTTPLNNQTTNEGATLGRVLFYDKRLSGTQTLSCGSCHRQQVGFADSTRFSIGTTGENTPRNAMSLVNARYSVSEFYFADSRTWTLERLAMEPVENLSELGNSRQELISRLAATDFYPQLFQAAFGTPDVTIDRISESLSQFLRSIISYRARIDAAYPTGSSAAYPQSSALLTPQENEGLALFATSGCIDCHRDQVQATHHASNNGLDSIPTDPNGFSVFRAASLRNIALTAPYMHDGRFATLREVIDFYDHGVQPSLTLAFNLLGASPSVPKRLNLTEAQKDALEAFLHTLTDTALLNDPKFSDPFQ